MHTVYDRAVPPKSPSLVSQYCKAASNALAELLWPTRCVVCDRPGELLCDHCRMRLSYIDRYRACPRCGAPYGIDLCSECNPVSLKPLGRKAPPFTACVSALRFDQNSARIIRSYKDQGERMLCRDMAGIMRDCLPPSWGGTSCLGFIPASHAAYRRRGFDHGELFAQALSDQTGIQCQALFERPRSKDQRGLSKTRRLTNMDSAFSLKAGIEIPRSMILLDDVYTTGATLMDACDQLRKTGMETILCATFARVY